MMTSRYEQPPHAPGGSRPPHRAGGAPRPPVVTPRADDTPPSAVPRLHLSRVAPHLDGLYTYCLFLLREPDMATCALAEALALAERRADRAPSGPVRPWLYALARWACRRRTVARPPEPEESLDTPGPDLPDLPDGPVGGARRAGPRARPVLRHLAEPDRLVWPEAAGTNPVQREALELSVRHGLSSRDVATVLRLEPDAARALLAGAVCEVERTRTALAVVAAGRCPVLVRFAAGGYARAPLGPSVRRELVRHVDECAACRRTAERVTAGAPWPGTAAFRAELPLLEAPVGALQAALRHVRATRPSGPRYDREGYPLPPGDRTGRRTWLRHRAVTTTVVATVAAAPALVLWAAYREPPTGGQDGKTPGEGTVTAGETPPGTDAPSPPPRTHVPGPGGPDSDPGDEGRVERRAETGGDGGGAGDADRAGGASRVGDPRDVRGARNAGEIRGAGETRMVRGVGHFRGAASLGLHPGAGQVGHAGPATAFPTPGATGTSSAVSDTRTPSVAAPSTTSSAYRPTEPPP
ncbi:RNA polymerase sigma factor, partial [Streptomyces sp. URMC 126]|uniref:RNA polymerase sigma factor n=1 Tax=Streptomyces sp. URMC 126 TaxID=3423401 RepID=UPI003F1A4563